MPLDSIVEGFLHGALRIILWIFVEVVFEFFIKGLGYLICRPFKKVEIDDTLCAIVGTLAWIFIIFLLMWTWG